VVLAGTFVTFLDFFIVNVALPGISADLDADPAAISLVVAGYGLTFAAGMITGGRLGDLYGRRRMFAIGLALFALTSAACGLAPSAGLLVAARMLQGAAGSLLTPQVLAILGTVYTGPRRATAFASYGFAMGIAGVLGQLVGGALIQADVAGLGWRTIFLINVPVGLVTLALVPRLVPESFGGVRERLDLIGMVLGTATITALVLPLAEGQEHGWPAWTWLSLTAAPVLAAGFVWYQHRRARLGKPVLIHLELFRLRTFSIGCLTALTFSLVPASFFFVLALYLQQGLGYSAIFSGVVFAVLGVGYFGALLGAGRLGVRALTFGPIVVGVGCLAVLEADRAGTAWALAPGLALVGAGIGLVLVPLSSTALAGVDPRHAGSAAGVLSTAQQAGGALGVAVTGAVFFGAGPVVHAFGVSLVVLAGVTCLTATLARFLRY
jgi:EmrB/QacA subfamily drug resistance transporter